MTQSFRSIKEAELFIDPMVYKKIMHWVIKAGHQEVSGLGKIQISSEGDLVIVDAILCKQVNSSGSTDLDEADVNKAMYELRDTPGDLKWWWHSHAHMDVFWSGTDMDTIEKLGQHGWFANSVFNAKYSVRSAIYMNTPIAIFKDNVILRRFAEPVAPEISAGWDKEYDSKVEKWESKKFRHKDWEDWDKEWSNEEQCYVPKNKYKRSGHKQKKHPLLIYKNYKENPTVFQAAQLADLANFEDYLGTDDVARANDNINKGKLWWFTIFTTRLELLDYRDELDRIDNEGKQNGSETLNTTA